MAHTPRTLCRNDFAPALRNARDWDEDYARECRDAEEAELAAPPVVLTASEQANEAYWREQEADYNRWLKRRSDFNCLGHVAYFERYGSYAPAPESYVPAMGAAA